MDFAGIEYLAMYLVYWKTTTFTIQDRLDEVLYA